MSLQQQSALRRLSFRVKDLSLIGKLKSSRSNLKPNDQQYFQIALAPRSSSIGINTFSNLNTKKGTNKVTKKDGQQWNSNNPQIGKTYTNGSLHNKKAIPVSNTTYLIPLKGPFPIMPKKQNKESLKGTPEPTKNKSKKDGYSNKKANQIIYANNFISVRKNVDSRLLQLMKNKSPYISSPRESNNSKIFEPVTHSRHNNYSPQPSNRKQRSPIAMHKVVQKNEQNSIGSIIKQLNSNQQPLSYDQGITKKKVIQQLDYRTFTNGNRRTVFNFSSQQVPSIDMINSSRKQFKQFVEKRNLHPAQSKRTRIQHQTKLMNFDNNSQADRQKSVYGESQQIYTYLQSSDPHYQNTLQKPNKNRQRIQIALTSFDDHQQPSQESLTDFAKMKGEKLIKQQQHSSPSKNGIGRIARISHGTINRQIQQATQTPISMQKAYQFRQLVQQQPEMAIQNNEILTEIQKIQSKLQVSLLYEQKKSQSPELDGSRIQQSVMRKNQSLLTIRMNVRQDDDHRSISSIAGDNKKQFGFIYCKSLQFSEELIHNKITLTIGSSLSKIKQLLVEAEESLQITFKIPQIMLLPPSRHDQKKELYQKMTEIFSYFNITPRIVTIKKYLNCIMFMLRDRQYCILWYFSGKVYVGKWNFNGKYYYSTTHEDKQEKQHGLIINRTEDFIEGVKHGLGFEWSPAKYLYFGQFQNNKKQGYGIMKKNTHEVYVGLWNNNQRHGWGKLYNQEGNLVHNGQFSQGIFQNATHLIQNCSKSNDSRMFLDRKPEKEIKKDADYIENAQQNAKQVNYVIQ